MAKTYLFYDIETSGLNFSFDQALQFAAIRTDVNLQEIARYEFWVKLNPDVIPSPQAFLAHRISLSKIFAQGEREYEVIKKIHQLFNAPETITIGYNTLGFDDEFLRFGFYRNLLAPYTHQYASGCGRFDLYPLAVFYYLFKPEVINWPKIAELNSLKLEHLSKVNQFVEGIAHDAMIDVAATLMLARAFYREKEMWEYLEGYFDKVIDEKRINTLPRAFVQSVTNYPYRLGLMLDGIFGAEKFYQCPVLFLGFHKHYKNQLLWLKLDNPVLLEITPDNFMEKIGFAIYRKKLAEPGFVLATEGRFIRHLTKERLELMQKIITYFATNQQTLAAIRDYYLERKYPVIPNLDIDGALYQNGFLSNSEQAFCLRFHQGEVADKITAFAKAPNSKLREQILRFLGRNYFEFLPVELKKTFQQYLDAVFKADDKQALIDYRGGKHLTLQAALNEIAKLKNQYAPVTEEYKLLLELEQYLMAKL